MDSERSIEPMSGRMSSNITPRLPRASTTQDDAISISVISASMMSPPPTPLCPPDFDSLENDFTPSEDGLSNHQDLDQWDNYSLESGSFAGDKYIVSPDLPKMKIPNKHHEKPRAPVSKLAKGMGVTLMLIVVVGAAAAMIASFRRTKDETGLHEIQFNITEIPDSQIPTTSTPLITNTSDNNETRTTDGLDT